MKANQEYIKTSYDNTASLFYNENLEIGIKINQEHENLFSHCFNEIKETPLFPFGDWRDLCYSTQIKSSEEVSVKSSDPTVNLEFISTYEHQKPQISKANFLENNIDQKHINSSNCVSSQETEAISSVCMLHKVFKIEKMRGQRRYTNRRDVITKSIIRYFYKYLCRFLKQNILNKRFMKSIDTLNQRIQDVCSSLDDYKNNYVSNNNPFDKELNQFIFCMIGKKQSYLKRQFGNKYLSKNVNQIFENMMDTQ